VLDALAITAPFGLLLGRFANFINGELLGKIVSPPGTPGPAWSVQFPQELLGWKDLASSGVLPRGSGDVLIRETLSHTPALTVEQQLALNTLVVSAMQTLGPTASWTDALRWILARPGAYRDQLIPLLSSRHPSQLYQAAAEGLVLGVVAWVCWLLYRGRAGVTASVWLVVYGVLRIVTEFWRLPDAQFGDAGRIIGLSRGQWFSVGMVVLGLVFLAYCLRSRPTGSSDLKPAEGAR
jgi:phosphatidylglycerol:prolipoprotein diacylglycerol transferase